MMVVKKFSLKFYKKTFELKNNEEIHLPKTGIVLIYGKSGEGKTTFFNALRARSKRKLILNYSDSVTSFNTEETIPLNYITRDLLQTANANILNEDIIEQLNLKGLLNKKTSELSGGEKSRVRLALALQSNAKVLLLDEPHVMVDEEAIKGELPAIKKTAEHKLVFIITHYPELYDTPYSLKIENGLLLNESKNQITQPEEASKYIKKNNKGLIRKRLKNESVFHNFISFLSVFIGLLLFVFVSTVATFSSLSNTKPNFDTFNEGYIARTVSVTTAHNKLKNSEKESFFAEVDASLFAKYYEYELLHKGNPPLPEFILESTLEEKNAHTNYISPLNNFYKVKDNIDLIEEFGKTRELAADEIALVIQKEGLEYNNFRGYFSALVNTSLSEYEALKAIDWENTPIATTFKYFDFNNVQSSSAFKISGVILTNSENGYYSSNAKWTIETIINELFGNPLLVDEKPKASITQPTILRTLNAQYIGDSNVNDVIINTINESGYNLTYSTNFNNEVIVYIDAKNSAFTKEKIIDVFTSLPNNLTIKNFIPRNLENYPLVFWKEVLSNNYNLPSTLAYSNALNHLALGYENLYALDTFAWTDHYFVMSKELAKSYYRQSMNKETVSDHELKTLIGKTFDFGVFSLKLGAIVIDTKYPDLTFLLTSNTHLLAINDYYFSDHYEILVNDYSHINVVTNYYATSEHNRGKAMYDFNVERVQQALDKYENYKAFIATNTTLNLIIAAISFIVVVVIYALTIKSLRKKDNFFANFMPKNALFKNAVIRLIAPLCLLLITFFITPLIYEMIQTSFVNLFASFTANNAISGLTLNKTIFTNYYPLATLIMTIIILGPTLLISLSTFLRINTNERSNY